MKTFKSILILLALISLGACSNTIEQNNFTPIEDNSSSTPSEIKVTGVNLEEHSLSLFLDDTYQLNYTVSPNNATNKAVSFSCNNNIVCYVNSKGLVTALNEGNSRITITTKDGNYTDTCNVEVKIANIPVTGLSLDKSSVILNEGETAQLNATISPSNADNKKVIWSSSDTSVATISNKGLITAMKEGTTTITARSSDETNKAGGYVANCVVTVNKVESPDTSIPDIEDGNEIARMQDTPILHCWNWSMSTIASHLSEIKEAGFKTIQLSPMQPQKDYYTSNGNNENWGNGWWKLYQPLGFVVATKNHSLGTKAELTALCNKAKSLDIDVIMDVVSNHLAGGSAQTINGGVKQYESDIYNKNLIHKNNVCQDWEDPKQLLTYPLGEYPDLQTENVTVQNRVISLLKEYIDCGVNGFRFDAAKHIETPDDGIYASDYWPNVIKGANEYASSLGLDEPFYYGETLNTIGNGRKYTSYTKYMSITDTRQGSTILNAVTNNSLNSLTDRYISGIDSSQLVLWAESHDTYADKSTQNITVADIHKAYMIQASRKNAATLYFARPESGTKLGDVGRTDYKNKEIKAINLFHNSFVEQSEDISLNNGCFINVRGNLGAAIVGISNTNNNVSLNVANLEDGKYQDLISEKEYTVSSNKVTVTLTNNACVLVNKEKSISTTPEISLGDYEEVYQNTQDITVNVNNATNVTYSINNGNKIDLTSNVISLNNDISDGKVNIKITATNESGSTSKDINLIKTTALVNSTIIITDVDTSYSYYVWNWSTGSDGRWLSLNYENNIAGVDMGNYNNFIIVKFAKNTSTPDWNKKINQTNDLSVTKRIWSFSELGLI